MDERPAPDELLSTGTVAGLLGSSRQHVVDLCTRGELAFAWAGKHRRIPRSSVSSLLGADADRLTRDQERSLWLHRAILGRLMVEPREVLDLARRNATRLLREQQRVTMTSHWLEEWLKVLDGGVDRVADVLGSRSPLALELRQNSPFAGALPQEVRSDVLAVFARHWREDHDRLVDA